MTKPIFIVSSGRSGSQMMEKLIKNFNNVEIHHEYLCNIIQPLATRYVMGLADKKKVKEKINQTYANSIGLTKKDFWIDSSNKISWLIEPLIEVFPDAKFIHLIRDGRRVTSSYFNKLNNECYSPECVKILYDAFNDINNFPPPEKKYWWPIFKIKGKESNFMKLSQYEQICVHWNEINNFIEVQLKDLPKSQSMQIRLEDLVSNQKLYEKLIQFIGLSSDQNYFETLKTPHNVNIPKSFILDETQKESFWNISKDTMNKYNYFQKEDYEVIY
tara:strand:- start:2203 stop:3021 length:819 start_codon:yes stop_codon:yes gene_type:complete